MNGGTDRTTAIAQDLPFLRELVGVTQDMVVTLQRRSATEVPVRFIKTFVRKAAQTARGVVLLYEAGLSLEAQSLVRILFEVSISFDAFLRLLSQDAHAACYRLLDATMLDKIRQQRASGFAGRELVIGAPGPDELDTTERDIASRYSSDQLKSIRRNGFSGLTVEARAQQGGREEHYNIIYRNFSRNVHGGDFTELLLAGDPTIIGDRHIDFLESRDTVACDVAFTSLYFVADATTRSIQLGFENRLATLAETRLRALH
jgi:hypothetical protein